jgi:hypothetical protein
MTVYATAIGSEMRARLPDLMLTNRAMYKGDKSLDFVSSGVEI